MKVSKLWMSIAFLLVAKFGFSQPFDTARYHIQVKYSGATDQYFRNDAVWRGADGASSVDLGNGKVLWLFSDSFTGHGIMVKDKLIVFLMKVRGVQTGLGFESFGWSAVLISNPTDLPPKWEMKYLKGPETFGLIAGSAAVLKDENYLYSSQNFLFIMRQHSKNLSRFNLLDLERLKSG